ncbi:MAG TPA: carboxypeptidase-like regulatory domain-containing protein [Pyrinomonadaceae bacterium]|nr:carboxypeptidase-like regulatory domain-containing protein [Pyrinomonadaceae bacterium]
MRSASSLCLSLLVLISVVVFDASAKPAGKRSLATIAGTVTDGKGTPLAGAIVSLVREGVKTVKRTTTDRNGNFLTKVIPGRYGISAIADGFNRVAFAAVEVQPSQELVYRFNLEPIGYGNTLPEKQRDREDAKWTLRSAQTRRSIFQAGEGEDPTIAAAEEAQTTTDAAPPAETTSDSRPRTKGVLETYMASNSYSPAYAGLNFAVATALTDDVDLIVAGQTGIGGDAPGRLEASTLFRVGDRHRVGVTAAGMRLATPIWMNRGANGEELFGQVSLRAIDEWIVRDGIVIVMGLDYSRFIGAGDAHSITPRFGIQYDVTARTRVKAAFASAGEDDGIQSIANFEGEQIVFRAQPTNPVAFVDGQAVLERSHRLEFGVERVLDNSSNLEATAFFDTTSGRGVGFLSLPATSFSGRTGESLVDVANQQGSSKGMRVVYTRRLNRVWTASAGYSFGRGQRLAAEFSDPSDMFENGFFQTAALQLGAGFNTGTQVRTVLRFSPNATVFAIDPFAGRLGVYDPSLSIQVTQELPTFGLPVRAEAIVDARNLLDVQTSSENAELLTFVGNNRRSVRGGISLRF